VAPEGAEAVRLDQERIGYWVSNGAQMSDTVARLVKQNKPAAAA
jgi:small subunit ribosomal protein S16